MFSDGRSLEEPIIQGMKTFHVQFRPVWKLSCKVNSFKEVQTLVQPENLPIIILPIFLLFLNLETRPDPTPSNEKISSPIIFSYMSIQSFIFSFSSLKMERFLPHSTFLMRELLLHCIQYVYKLFLIRSQPKRR